MSPVTRILNFRASDLGKDAALVLAFDPEDYRSVFGVVWKVAHFGASGHYQFQLRYRSEFGFIRAEITSGDIVVASAYINVNAGEKSILTETGHPPVYSWSTPSHIQPPTNQIEGENGTNGGQNIALGLSNPERPGGEPAPVLLFTDVARQGVIRLEFTPVVSGYITSDFKEGQILRAPIESPVVFKENLATLDEESNWELVRDPATGEFRIIRA